MVNLVHGAHPDFAKMREIAAALVYEARRLAKDRCDDAVPPAEKEEAVHATAMSYALAALLQESPPELIRGTLMGFAMGSGQSTAQAVCNGVVPLSISSDFMAQMVMSAREVRDTWSLRTAAPAGGA